MKFLNESITFLFELFMLVAIFLASFKIFDSMVIFLTVSIVVSTVIIFIWGNYLAPNGKNRVSAFWGLLITTVLTSIGPIAFYLLYPGIIAISIIALYLLNRIFAIVWKQW